MVARFIRIYGAGAYWNEAHPTHDHVIPWKLFQLLSARMETMGAVDKVTTAEGVATAISLTMGQKGTGKEPFMKLLQLAYPDEVT